MKWSWVGLLTCTALGCWAMAFVIASHLKGDPKLKMAPDVVMRAVSSSASPSTKQHAKTEVPKPPPRHLEAAPANLEAAAAQDARPNREVETPSAEPEVPAKPLGDEVTGKATAPAAVPMGGDGILNLIASDSAEVLLDGTRIGPSPKRGIRLTAGSYKVRFDCYDGDGELKAGAEQTVEVVAGKETHVEHDCPTTH